MRRLLTILLLVGAFVPALPGTACAHTALKDASPGPGDKIAPGANVISLTFDELKPGSTPKLGLQAPDQITVPIGTPVVGDNGVVCAAVPPLAHGVHTLTYTVTAADNQTQTNKFFFTVTDTARPVVTPPACSTGALPLPGRTKIRLTTTRSWLDTRTALFLVGGMGAGVIGVTVVGRARRRRRARSW